MEAMSPRKAAFDVTDPAVALRLMCGLFYIPHVLYKVLHFSGSTAFFAQVFPYPTAFLVLAMIAETLCFLGLTFDVLVKWAGLLSAGVMACAIYATLATKGVSWMWNLGGVEYLLFWGAASAALAVREWKQELRDHGRFSVLAPATQAA